MKKEYKYIYIFDNGKKAIQKKLTIKTSLEDHEEVRRRADAQAIQMRDNAYPGYEVYVTCSSVVNIQIS